MRNYGGSKSIPKVETCGMKYRLRVMKEYVKSNMVLGCVRAIRLTYDDPEFFRMC